MASGISDPGSAGSTGGSAGSTMASPRRVVSPGTLFRIAAHQPGPPAAFVHAACGIRPSSWAPPMPIMAPFRSRLTPSKIRLSVFRWPKFET